MNASQVLVILLLELLSITIISHAFIIAPTTITTLLRPVVVVRSVNEVGILSNKFGITPSSTSALEASSSESESTEVEVDTDTSSLDKLTVKEKNVYTMLKELSNSNLLFRIVVVVGNGAILESTNLLGSMKLNQSPVSGANIVTFASNNQSFEFHLMIGQIDKVAFIEKDSPINKGKTMRIIRFINDESGGKSICSLILATAVAATSAADGVDDNDDTIAYDWFKIMISKYSSEHTFLN